MDTAAYGGRGFKGSRGRAAVGGDRPIGAGIHRPQHAPPQGPQDPSVPCKRLVLPSQDTHRPGAAPPPPPPASATAGGVWGVSAVRRAPLSPAGKAAWAVGLR